MNTTTIIILNAVLDLAAVLAVLGVVRLTHRLREHPAPVETIHPSQPIPLRLALQADETEERLAKAA